MKFLLAVLFVFAVGTTNAYQYLTAGGFLYNNITIGNNMSIVSGIDSSGPLQMIILKSSSFRRWFYGYPTQLLVNETVGSGIYVKNLSAGSYVVIFSVKYPENVSSFSFGIRRGLGKVITIAGTYRYPVYLGNYSLVNVSLLTDRNFRKFPISINFSGQLGFLNGDGNYDSMYNISLNRGEHYFTIYSTTPTEAFLVVKSQNQTIDPLGGFFSGESYPVGVVSYGVFNKSGTLLPYQISTSGVVGDANISDMSAQDFNLSDNNSAFGASLQLNIEMNTQMGGKNRVFWIQNVVDFNTSKKSYYFVSNIWNNTYPTANMENGTVVGKGTITVCGVCGNQAFYAYSYPEYLFNYSLPFNIKLVILENQTANGTLDSFGYQVLENGSSGSGPLVFYDRVLFPGAVNSTFLVTPFYFTPSIGNLSGNYYDAELVFGGESGGAQSYFNRLAATAWIYYYVNGTLVPFPSAYTFGEDTAETAANLRTVTSGYGNGGFITTGRLNPNEQIVVDGRINSTAHSIQNASGVEKQPTTTVQGSGQGALLSQISQMSALVNYIAVVLILLALIMLFRMIVRRR